MQNDWFLYRNPDKSWIASVAGVPGFKWNFGAQGNGARRDVVSVGWHLSHAPLMPPYVHDATSELTQPSIGTRVTARARADVVPLRSYQLDDLPFILARRASLIGYEMRVGKTPLATVAHNPADGPLVIVAPLIARDVWRTWIKRVFGYDLFALTSRTPQTFWPASQAYFVHYDILDAHAGNLQNAGTVILDECHLLQARRSKRISAAAIVAANAKRIIALSGTPMWSNPRSLWPILNLLSPGAWGTEFEFLQRYTHATPGAYGWKYDGINNESELRQRLDMLLIRRTWHSVLGALPPVTNIVEPVELSSSERANYEMQAQRMQLLNASNGEASNVAGYLSTLRRMFGHAKIPRTLELTRQALADNHKVVIWTWHVEVANKIAHELLHYGDGVIAWQLKAEYTQTQRETAIREFNEVCAPIPAVMVASLAVAGTAIDLSTADLNIFTELDYIPATVYQASMRLFKPDRPSSNVFMFADVPIERRLVEVLGCNEACQAQAGLGYTQVAEQILAGELV